MTLEINEYEQQMVAAGFIPVESLDNEYQEYLDSTRYSEEQMSYQEWQACRARWDELDAFYRANIEPLYTSDALPLTYEQKQMEDRYWREVNALEVALGY